MIARLLLIALLAAPIAASAQVGQIATFPPKKPFTSAAATTRTVWTDNAGSLYTTSGAGVLWTDNAGAISQ